MKPKNKPTTEELQAQIDAAINPDQPPAPPTPPADPPQDPPTPPTPPTPPADPTPPPGDDNASPSIPDDTGDEGDEGEDGKPKGDKDLKKKLSDSSREALILHTKNKKINEAIETASNLPEPTEEELRTRYPNWDDMDETTQSLARDAFISSRRFAVIAEATKEFKNLDQWVSHVDEFVDDPQTLIRYPALEGKVEDFREFASKPSRKGADFSDLIAAFMWDTHQNKPKPNRGKQIEPGSGGPPGAPIAPKDGKISLDEAAMLMKTDYKKYKQYLNAGKIDFSKVA
jgi:hypothetical protein